MNFLQSGSALADWAIIVDKYRAQNTSRVYAQHIGCSIETSWKLVNCLKQGRSHIDLANSEFMVSTIFPILFNRNLLQNLITYELYTYKYITSKDNFDCAALVSNIFGKRSLCLANIKINLVKNVEGEERVKNEAHGEYCGNDVFIAV